MHTANGIRSDPTLETKKMKYPIFIVNRNFFTLIPIFRSELETVDSCQTTTITRFIKICHLKNSINTF